MAVPGLPSADSLIPSIAALRRRLATEEAGFRNTLFTATSTDTNVTASANGMVEALTVTIKPTAFPTKFPPTVLTALAASIKDACGKALNNANNDSKPKASADAAGYTLANIPNLGAAPPTTQGFQSSDADLTALLRAQDTVIAGKQFQGISGPVSAIVDGTLSLVSITLTPPMPPSKTILEENVVIAINLALAKAKHLFEDGIGKRVTDGLDSSAVTFQVACLWAQGDLVLADRVRTQEQEDDKTYAPVVNAGPIVNQGTNVGSGAQTGDLWSRTKVDLRSNAKVNGNLRSMSDVSFQDGASVSGIQVSNGALLQIPRLSLSVNFPSGGVDKTVPDQLGNKTLDLQPGTFRDVTINSQGTLTLHSGIYFFNNWTVNDGATINTFSGGGLITIHIRNGFTFRGKLVEKSTGLTRPRLFVGVYGNGSIPIGGSGFAGTLVALNSSVTLNTLPKQTPKIFHTGAFYAKTIQVDPDNTIKHFPYAGPAPSST